MHWKNSATAYGLVARSLHWLIALLILALIWLGWYMVGLTYYDRWYNAALHYHRAVGMAVLLLGLAVIAWNLHNRPPPMVASLKRWEKAAAHAVHGFLYLAMVLLPLSGYLISTSAGDGVALFGGVEIPALVSLEGRARDGAIAVHYYLAYGALGLVCVHAGAALKHQFLDRDGTLRRML